MKGAEPLTTAYVPCPRIRPTLYLQGTVATCAFEFGSAIAGRKKSLPPMGMGMVCVCAMSQSRILGREGRGNVPGYNKGVEMWRVREVTQSELPR
jgi:hypothetical protein